MWYKINNFSFSLGVGTRETGGKWLTFTQYGYIILSTGIAAWLAVKLPVIIILVGVIFIVSSYKNS